MTRLLVVHHAPSRSLSRLAEAVLAGAHDPRIAGVDVVRRDPLEATVDDVLEADGYVLGTAAHFGYMSGALKHFFDGVFLGVGGALDATGAGSGAAAGATARRPYALWAHGRYDTTGAVRSVESIVGALGWTRCAPPLEVLGDVDEGHLEAAYDLGATVAALLAS